MPRQDVPYPGAGRCSLRCEIANLWNALKTKLHSINGVQGDGNGDVKILAGQNVQIVNDQVHGEITISATGGGSDDAIKTVNGVSPDGDGEVTITAGSNITISPDTDTNSIEIEATVPTVDAVAPIYIDADGKINLADWEIVNYYDWSGFVSDLVVQEDLLLFVNHSNLNDDMYLAKGMVITYHELNAVRGSFSGTRSDIYIGSIPLSNIFSSGNTVNIPYGNLVITRGGSGIDETVDTATNNYSSTMNKIITPNTSGEGVRLFKRKVPQ